MILVEFAGKCLSQLDAWPRFRPGQAVAGLSDLPLLPASAMRVSHFFMLLPGS